LISFEEDKIFCRRAWLQVEAGLDCECYRDLSPLHLHGVTQVLLADWLALSSCRETTYSTHGCFSTDLPVPPAATKKFLALTCRLFPAVADFFGREWGGVEWRAW